MVDPRFRTAFGDTRSPRSIADRYVVEPGVLQASFMRRLRAEGKSESTISRYDLVLRQFVGESAVRGYPWPPSGEHVADYLARQREDGKAKNTVRNSHVALRSWFNWLLEEGEIADHPMARLKTPPLDLGSPDPYSDDEIRAMLAVCRGRHWTDARDAAIVAVLADTGLRASEFCSLTVEDVELDADRIRIIGKGGRHRFVGFGKVAQDHLDRYLRRKPQQEGALWLNRTGGAITVSGLYQIIERITKAAKVGRPGVHRFRHYAATAMLRRGMGEMDLAKFMGWEGLEMAQRYTKHDAQERALRSHKRYSPLDGL